MELPIFLTGVFFPGNGSSPPLIRTPAFISTNARKHTRKLRNIDISHMPFYILIQLDRWASFLIEYQICPEKSRFLTSLFVIIAIQTIMIIRFRNTLQGFLLSVML